MLFRSIKLGKPTIEQGTVPEAGVELQDELGNPIQMPTPKEQIGGTVEDFKAWQENQKSMKNILESEPQAKVSPTARQDLYAMRVVKGGLEMAAKPKQLARLAKTELPAAEREKAAPEYVIVVDKLYNVNKDKPNAFKNTYDEVARTYKDDPAVREQAQKYLVAKDTLEGQVSKPLA